jgi:hypothetical protein
MTGHERCNCESSIIADVVSFGECTGSGFGTFADRLGRLCVIGCAGLRLTCPCAVSPPPPRRHLLHAQCTPRGPPRHVDLCPRPFIPGISSPPPGSFLPVLRCERRWAVLFPPALQRDAAAQTRAACRCTNWRMNLSTLALLLPLLRRSRQRSSCCLQSQRVWSAEYEVDDSVCASYAQVEG